MVRQARTSLPIPPSHPMDDELPPLEAPTERRDGFGRRKHAAQRVQVTLFLARADKLLLQNHARREQTSLTQVVEQMLAPLLERLRKTD